jgi:hypothetical protein
MAQNDENRDRDGQDQSEGYPDQNDQGMRDNRSDSLDSKQHTSQRGSQRQSPTSGAASIFDTDADDMDEMDDDDRDDDDRIDAGQNRRRSIS